jgi:hypothetical protein
MRSSCGGSPRPTGSTLTVPPITAACGGAIGARGPSWGPSRVSRRWTSAGPMAHVTPTRGNRNSPRSRGERTAVHFGPSLTASRLRSVGPRSTHRTGRRLRPSAARRPLPAGRVRLISRPPDPGYPPRCPVPAAQRRKLAISHVRPPYRARPGRDRGWTVMEVGRIPIQETGR